MAKHAEERSKTGAHIIIILFVVLLLGGGIYFVVNNNTNTNTSAGIFNKSIKDEIVTAENYEELTKKVAEKMSEDEELYYFSYSIMYYIMKDGLTEEYLRTQEESLLYKNIYNKTVKKLISEGKQLMKENNITVEQYKQKLSDLSNTTE